MSRPNFTRERKAIALGQIVCGVDEAGRGPLAGPVVAAAVVLDPKRIPKGLDDSKQLNEKKRGALFDLIMRDAQVGVGIIGAEVIDRINILQATFVAMSQAVDQVATVLHLALIDGNRAPALPCKVETIIRGDRKSSSIAAASIVAKVTRDRLMQEQHLLYPHYGFSQHKGYGTEEHLAAIAAFGPCPLHRRSFSPFKLVSGTQQLAPDRAD
jgi:ribonuclease HII